MTTKVNLITGNRIAVIFDDVVPILITEADARTLVGQLEYALLDRKVRQRIDKLAEYGLKNSQEVEPIGEFMDFLRANQVSEHHLRTWSAWYSRLNIQGAIGMTTDDEFESGKVRIFCDSGASMSVAVPFEMAQHMREAFVLKRPNQPGGVDAP